MIDGAFIAYKYEFTVGGKTFRGDCEGVTKDTKFDGLGDSREDKMSALGVMMACSIGHEFTDGDKDWGYQKYRISFDRGKSWQHQNRKFRMEGNKVILVNSLTRQDCPDSETGIMTLDGDLLTVTNKNVNNEGTMIYKKKQL